MKYEPKKNTIDFEFPNGVTFVVDPMKAQSRATEIQELLKEPMAGREGELVDPAMLKKMCKNARVCVDLLLDETGASNKILDANAGYYDIMDVYFFILKNVNAKCAEKNAERETKTK